MTKRLIALLMAVIMLLSLCMTSCSTEKNTATETAEDDTLRKNLVLTIYAITGDNTTEESLRLVEEKISNYCVAKYKTAIDLRFYKESEYQKALNEMYDKFAALEQEKAAAEELAKKQAAEEKELKKTMTAEQKKEYEQQKRLEQKKAEDEAKKKAEEEAALIEQGKDVATVKDVQMDILFIPGATEYYSNVDQGLLIDLNSYLTSQFKVIKDFVHPSFLTGVSINNGIYAIPNNHAISGEETYLLINTALAEKYNVDLTGVRSIYALEDVYEQVLRNDGTLPINGDFAPENYYFYDGIDSGHLIGVFTDTLVGGRYGNPSAATPAINSMMKDYVAADENDQRTSIVDFGLKKYQYRQKGYITGNLTFNPNINFFLAVQQLNEEEKAQWEEKGYTPVLYKGADFNTEVSMEAGLFGISKYCEEPERAMEILQLLSCDEGFRNLLAFGVEDVHYTRKSLQSSTITVIDNSYEMDFLTAGNSLLGFLPDTMDPKTHEKGKAKNFNSYLNPFLGMHLDWSDDANAEYKDAIAAIAAICQPVWDQINYGVANYRELMDQTYDRIENNSLGELEMSYQDLRAKCSLFQNYAAIGTAVKKLDSLLDMSAVSAPSTDSEAATE